MVILYQVSIISIIATLYFSFNYRRNDQGDNSLRNEHLDSYDKKAGIIVGIILSILTLPPPNCLISCLKPNIVLEKEIDKKTKTSEKAQKE